MGTTTTTNNNNNEIENNNLPILCINISKLCGYIPKTNEEYNTICNDIKISLFGNNNTDNDISINFYNHCCELLESNIAIHSDTTSSITTTEKKEVNNNKEEDNNYSWFNVSYPEYI